jgi:hypothetical protein
MTTLTGQQPPDPAERPPRVASPGSSAAMTPLDIAQTRLGDLAQGAVPDLFSQLDAAHVYNRLDYLEQRYDGLRRAARGLLDTIEHVQLIGTAPELVQLARAIDLTADELNQP